MSKLTLSHLGQMLRKKRGPRGVREVAKEIGISPATLSRVERGNQPDLTTFPKICRWLEVDPAELLGFQKETPGNPIISAHLRAPRVSNSQLVQGLAELIVAAQGMMSEDTLSTDPA